MADVGITASVGSVADAYDNAMAEAVISTFKKELVYRRVFRTREEVEFAIVEWINWYNERRLHSRSVMFRPVSMKRVGIVRTTIPTMLESNWFGLYETRGSSVNNSAYFNLVLIVLFAWALGLAFTPLRPGLRGTDRRVQLLVLPAVSGVTALIVGAIVWSEWLTNLPGLVRSRPRVWILLASSLVVGLVGVDWVLFRVAPRVSAWLYGRKVASRFGVHRLSAAIILVLFVAPTLGAGLMAKALNSHPQLRPREGETPGASSGIRGFSAVDLGGIPMGLVFDDARGGYITLADGRILHFDLSDEPARLTWKTVAAGLGHLRGIAVADGSLLVVEILKWPCEDPPAQARYCRGDVVAGGEVRIIRESSARVLRLVIREDGSLGTPVPVVEDLPVVSHQHAPNGLIARDGLLYLAIGNVDMLWREVERVEDAGHPRSELLGSILRFRPDGSAQRVFASGLRNVYGLAFSDQGELYGIDNDGPFLRGPDRAAWRGEEVLLVREGDHHGFPLEGSFSEGRLRTQNPLWLIDAKGSAGVEWAPRIGLQPGLIVGSCGELNYVRLTEDGQSAGREETVRTPVKHLGAIDGCTPIVSAGPGGRLLLGTTTGQLLFGRIVAD